MKRADAWMPLYIGDYLADTARLTTEQHGAYLLLLMDYWRNGPPPDDDETLAAICKMQPAAWRKLAPRVRAFFTVEDGHLHQKRMDSERVKAADIGGKRKAAGAEGAAKRWGKNDGKAMANGMANGMANASQTDACAGTPSQSPSPGNTENSHGLAGAGAGEPDLTGQEPTLAGIVCGQLRRMGIPDTNPGHPSLLALLDAGAQPSEFAAFAERAKGKSAPFRWLLGALAGERKSAADMASQLHRGAMPSRAPTAAEQRVLQAVPGLAAPHLRAQAAALPAELAEVIDVTPRRLG